MNTELSKILALKYVLSERPEIGQEFTLPKQQSREGGCVPSHCHIAVVFTVYVEGRHGVDTEFIAEFRVFINTESQIIND